MSHPNRGHDCPMTFDTKTGTSQQKPKGCLLRTAATESDHRYPLLYREAF